MLQRLIRTIVPVIVCCATLASGSATAEPLTWSVGPKIGTPTLLYHYKGSKPRTFQICYTDGEANRIVLRRSANPAALSPIGPITLKSCAIVTAKSIFVHADKGVIKRSSGTFSLIK